MILLLAALSGVPTDTLEAARVDGASPAQVRWLIAVPAIRTTILLSTILAFVGGLQVWEFVYAMTNGGPAGGTASLMYYIYAAGLLRGKYGLASAGSVVILALGLTSGIIIRRRRDS